MERNDVVWTEKYRPQTVNDCILPDHIKEKFQEFVNEGEISSNLMLLGTPGVGKTTIAIACVKQIDAEYMIINASTHGNIDTLRYKVEQFVTRMSFNGGRKYVIFDEAEGLTAETQKGIRGFIEQYSKQCGFIFTCNNMNNIHEAIQSRTVTINFNFTNDEQKVLLKAFAKRVFYILNEENIKYDKKDIVNFIIHNKAALDFRNLLLQIQYASVDGSITPSSLKDKSEKDFENLIELVKGKQFEKCREWLHTHPEYTHNQIFRKFYDMGSHYVTKNTVPLLVMSLAKYQYQASFAVDQEINLASFLADCMVDLEFK